MKRRFQSCVGILLAVGWASPRAEAQANPVPYDKHPYWFGFTSNVQASEKVSLYFNTGYRIIDDSTWRQWLVRPGVTVDLNPNWELSFTYGYFSSHPNGLRVDTYSVPEHRVHQQVSYKHGWGRLTARHRVRNEQRAVGAEFLGSTPRAWRFQERLRYQFRTDVPLKRQLNESPKLFLTFYDEVAARFAYHGTSHFDQNRLYSGVGWRPSHSTLVELGAIFQRFKPLSGLRFEHNLILQLNVTADTSLKRLGALFH